MNDLLVGVALFSIVAVVLNVVTMVECDCKEWFKEFREHTICELILVFTLFLPTTILFALIYILSIKPFKRKEK